MRGNKEYYKAIPDILKIIIAPLFVAGLGLIGYAYTSNDFNAITALMVDVIMIMLLLFAYGDVAQNLKD